MNCWVPPQENEDEDEPRLDETVNIKDTEEAIKAINHRVEILKNLNKNIINIVEK